MSTDTGIGTLLEDAGDGDAEDAEMAADIAKREPVEVETDVYTERKYEVSKEVTELSREAPELRFYHPSTFTEAEDKLIAACLGTATYYPISRIAQKLHCSVKLLKKHLEKTPVLLEMVQDRDYRQKEEAEEALGDLVKARDAQTIRWILEKTMPEKYGDQVNMDNEDDTRLVIGEIPQSELEAAEQEIAAASEKPPETELGAVAEEAVRIRERQHADDVAQIPDGIQRPSEARSIPAAPERTIDEFGGGGQDDYADISGGEDFGDNSGSLW